MDGQTFDRMTGMISRRQASWTLVGGLAGFGAAGRWLADGATAKRKKKKKRKKTCLPFLDDCATGAQCCSGVCCHNTCELDDAICCASEDEGEFVACSVDLPTCCEVGCCKQGRTCCLGGCCPAIGASCCEDDETCCPPDFPVCCVTVCCPAGEVCLSPGVCSGSRVSGPGAARVAAAISVHRLERTG